MGEFATLSIGGYELTSFKNHPFGYGVPQWLIVFTERDRQVVRQGRKTTYRYEIVAETARHRLDLMGFSSRRVKAAYTRARRKQLHELDGDDPPSVETEHLRELTYEVWCRTFAGLKNGAVTPWDPRRQLTALETLLLADDDYRGDGPFAFPGIDPRWFLRAVLELCDRSEHLVFDYTDLVGWTYRRGGLPCSEARDALAGDPSSRPVVVLTEGKTDRVAIEGALKLLHPSLSDYYTFFDFEENRAPGGADYLANVVKAFVGAKISNRVIALFDNDSAAACALRDLADVHLPANMRVLQLPQLPMAMRYPTMGPTGRKVMNINGLATALELYFGAELLQHPTGGMEPVVWTGNVAGKWQGRLENKAIVQKKFSAKLQRALANPEQPLGGDWTGMQLICNALLKAFE